MSYQLNVLGYGYSRELEAEGPLTEALSGLDAKFASFDFGSFLHEMAGMRYKEVDGGFYSWMLYRVGGDGDMRPAQEGLNTLRPRPGERIYVVYQFFPSASHQEREAYALPELPDLPKKPESPQYHFIPPEEYALPELIEYGDFTVEAGEPTLTMFEEEEQKRPSPSYFTPEFAIPTISIEVYQVVRPRPTPLRLPVPEFEDNSDLERFLMDLLAGARLNFLLAPTTSEEELAVPLAQV